MKRYFSVYTLFFLCCIYSNQFNAQSSDTKIGIGFGLGSFFGNFPAQTTFNGKLSFEINSPISLFDKLETSLSYGQKIEKFLPDSYNYKHYSYFSSVSFAGVFIQPLGMNLTISEAIGLIYLNDRSFSDIDEWNLGMMINISGGIPLSKRVELALSIDYGLTFTNTNSSYIAYLIYCKYKL